MSCPFLEQKMHLRVLTGFSGAGRRLLVLAMGQSLSFFTLARLARKGFRWVSEGRFVVATGERARRRGAAPRVVAGLTGRSRRRTGATATATAATEAAAPATTARGLVDLGGGITQRRSD